MPELKRSGIYILKKKIMGVKQMLQIESSTAIEEVINIPFEFKNVPEGKNPGEAITISPATVRTWFKLKSLLALIEKEDYNKMIAKEAEMNDEIRDVMSKYDGLLFEIVCTGIHNKEGDMPKWFKEVLMDSCTWKDIYILLNAILFRLHSSSFMNSIIALKTVSPIGEAEIIALQKNKRTWSLKAASPSS